MKNKTDVKRCAWAFASQQYIDYHDNEWGVPVHDERKLFEMLILEGVQAGLSWSLILKKRAGYLEAFDGIEANKVAHFYRFSTHLDRSRGFSAPEMPARFVPNGARALRSWSAGSLDRPDLRDHPAKPRHRGQSAQKTGRHAGQS